MMGCGLGGWGLIPGRDTFLSSSPHKVHCPYSVGLWGGLFLKGKDSCIMKQAIHFHLMPRVRMYGALFPYAL